MPTLKQPAFSGGIVSPQVIGRTDLQKYATGLRTCANAWITRYGTVENRAGTIFTAAVKDSTTTKRFVSFEVSVNQGMLLEFGANYIRFFKNGAAVLAPVSGGAYVGGTTYAFGAAVTYGGLTYVSLAAANTGNQPDISPLWWSQYVTGTGGVLELPTVLGQGALQTFTVSQVNDIMYLADQSVVPQVLKHYGDQVWSITPFAVSIGINPPANLVVTPEDPGSTFSETYVVTSLSSTTGLESLPSAPVTQSCGRFSPSFGMIATWDANPAASGYNIYRQVAGGYGFIGTVTGTRFADINYLPDISKQPPTLVAMFQTSSDYPGVTGTYQQRLMFANTVNQPQSVWGSTTGVYTSFTNTTPIVDSGTVQFTVAGRNRQYIRALVDLGKLVVHTSNNEYVAQGNQFGALTPTATTLAVQGSSGCAAVQPVTLGNTDIFVQQGATRLNDLRYEVQSFAYTGKDLTKIATDIFRGRTIVTMCWQRLPHSIVWCVLDNGTLAALTYVREDELWAWHLHTFTNGAVEWATVVPEGAATTLYLLVKRTVNGVTKRYIERIAPRDCIDTVLYTDSIFADASLTYDGRNVGATTMTVTTGAGWTQQDLLTITATPSYFVSGDVGNKIVLQQIDSITGLVTDQVSFDIVAYTSSTSVSAVPERLVPTWAQATATAAWGKAVKSFSGIGHLEAQSLSILADGVVVANPLTPTYPVITVSGGAFTLPQPAMVVTAGLPIQMDLQTLPLENAAGESIAHKRITIRECSPIFYRSRGGLFGQDSSHLNAWKQPKTTGYSLPVDPYTGPARVPIQGTPEQTGQIWARLTDPVPFSISAVVITCEIGN